MSRLRALPVGLSEGILEEAWLGMNGFAMWSRNDCWQACRNRSRRPSEGWEPERIAEFCERHQGRSIYLHGWTLDQGS